MSLVASARRRSGVRSPAIPIADLAPLGGISLTVPSYSVAAVVKASGIPGRPSRCRRGR
jgi:hypothetical protein